MPSTLRIHLLGGLALSWDGRSLGPLESSRAESLLAYLLLNPAPQSRAHLAFVLWPDSTESQALTNLRHQLHNLRRALPNPEEFLEATRRTIRWRQDAPYWLDITALEAAASASEVNQLKEAVALYRGDLLEGSNDEWLEPHRDRLRRIYLDLLERLTGRAAEEGLLAVAIEAAEQLIRHDPFREESHRSLMRLHFANQDTAMALRTYHACAAELERELGVEPSDETRSLYEELLGSIQRSEGQPPAVRVTASTGAHMIGRSVEWENLKTAWLNNARRPQRLAILTGEAGIGKTRLVEEFRGWCAHRGATVLTANAFPAEGTLAFGLVVSWLRSPEYAGFENLNRSQAAQLARLLPELRGEGYATNVPEVDGAGGDQLGLFDAVAGALLVVRAPLLLVAEDLHWADRQSLEFLHYLIRLDPPAPLLVVGTARSEEVDSDHPLHRILGSLRAQDRLLEIRLDRLTFDEAKALAEQIAGTPLDSRTNEIVFSESEGNPLFIVEAVRAGLPGIDPKRLPLSPRVKAVVDLRLAQLSEQASAVLAIAATVGREFSIELLERAGGSSREQLISALDELWRRRIVREQGTASYEFSHDKIREVVYQNLSPMVRRHLHERVAVGLEKIYAEQPEGVSHQVATHYDLGGKRGPAAAWYGRAAGEALLAHARELALELLQRGLELLALEPGSRARDESELSLLVTSLAPRSLVEGSASENLQEAQHRALSLVNELDVEPPAPLLRSSALTSLCLADFDGARRMAGTLHARGERHEDDVLVVEAEYLLGIAAFWEGRLPAARTHFEHAVDHYRTEHRVIHRLRYGLDPEVICLSRLANTLWFLGYPDAAERTRSRAMAAAERLGHLPTLATATVFAAFMALEQRDHSAFRRYSADLDSDRLRQGSRATDVTAAALGGLVEVLDGRPHIGIGILTRAVEESYHYRHAPGFSGAMLRLLLEAESAAGWAAEGLATAQTALRFPDGARLWEAEVRRLHACFLSLSGGEPAQVDAELQRAIEVAKKQSSSLLGLRTATTLVEHRVMHGGDLPAAYRLLEQASVQVKDGENCADLLRASALLART